MNFTKALDLITKTDKQIKELGEARDKLQLSLAALAELDHGAKVVLRLDCKPLNGQEERAEMCIDEIINGSDLAAYIYDALRHEARRNYLQLLDSQGGEKESGEEISPELEKKKTDRTGTNIPNQPTIPKMPEKKKTETEIPEKGSGAGVPNSIPNRPNSIPNQPEIETPEESKPRKKAAPGTVDKAKLADMYFKQGKSAKEIASETGWGQSTVFNYLAAIRAEKEKTAKECARR